jgi:adenosylcobyric acid synthase
MRALMIQGTGSNVGKSLLVAGLCRVFARKGLKVRPFKPQNMSNNAAVTADGGEIGRAQALQARAAGVAPSVHMNPVLLKPQSEIGSQVVVQGRVAGTAKAREYQSWKPRLMEAVLDSFSRLSDEADLVLVEGAGSASEVNLRAGDIANMGFARAADVPVVLVGDIDRGGVIASLVGTKAVLDEADAAMIRGFVVNRFRGDAALLGDACEVLERRSGVPTLGVVPMIGGTDLDAEDSLALDRGWATGSTDATLDVAVIRLPHIANFGDLDPLRVEPGVGVRLVRSPGELGRPHLVVLPGSKATRADLDWLRSAGLDTAIEGSGAPVVAVCAGAQMVGERIDDDGGIEGPPGSTAGLGWVRTTTAFAPGKVLDRPSAKAVSGAGAGEAVDGFRMHQGRIADVGADPWLVTGDGDVVGWRSERVFATAVHGLFEPDGFRRSVLAWVADRNGLPPPAVSPAGFGAMRMARIDAIADVLEAHLDLDRIVGLIAEGAQR